MKPATVTNPLLDAALSYAERGWHVFPVWHALHGTNGSRCACPKGNSCTSPAKHPRTQNGLKDATTDADQVRAWWRECPQASVGIRTGAASGLWAFDVDVDKGGSESFADLCDEHGQLPETVEARTGGGGTHLFFRHPGRPVKNSNSEVAAGLDVRGEGGYVLACPSTHKSGNRYAWIIPPNDREPADAPDWLLAKVCPAAKPPAPSVPPPKPAARHESDVGEYWLGKALVKADAGKRNDVGYWLAQQLRDAGVSEAEATEIGRRYQRKVDRADKPYGEAEILASVRSAYDAPPRAPAASAEKRFGQAARPKRPEPKVAEEVKAPASGAAAELLQFGEDVISGKVYEIPFPWPTLTEKTQALLPGSITVVCGSPGVGKTFWVLQCLQFWHANGYRPAVFFIEKDRKFHTRRLLAQLEGRGDLAMIRWIRENPLAFRSAMERHGPVIDLLGALIYSEPEARVTLVLLRRWIEERCAEGAEILIIDPITAAYAGADRWLADDDFVVGVQSVLNKYGARLVVITHPKTAAGKNGKPGAADMGGGAAYNRFADTNLWLGLPEKPRVVVLKMNTGNIAKQGLQVSGRLLKTREGKGNGLELAYTFDQTLTFAEQGIVLKEANDQGEQWEAKADRPGPRAPRVAPPQNFDLDELNEQLGG